MNRIKSKTPLLYLQYAFSASPWLSLAMVGLRLVLAVLPTVQVGILGSFLQEAQRAISGGSIGRELLGAAVLLMGILVCNVLVQNVYGYVRLRHRLQVGLAYDMDLAEKKSRLPYALLEDSDTQDFLEKVTVDATDAIHDGFCNLLDLAEYALRIAGICTMVLVIRPISGVVTLALFAGMVYLAVAGGREDYVSHTLAVKEFRKSRAFRRILAGQEHAAERTLFSATDLFDRKWAGYFAAGRENSLRASRKEMLRLALGGVTVLGFTCLIGILLAFPLRRGTLPAGGYISILAACIQLSQMICWYAALLVEDFTRGSLQAGDIGKFFALPEVSIPVPEKQRVETIEFRNVSFAYPNTKKEILHDFNAVFTAGKSYALVGENGAGKSTLIKLLLGLYDSYTGKILVDGRELCTISPEKQAGMFACVFQDFARFEGTVAENLAPGRELEKQEQERLLSRVGLLEAVNALPQKADTPLGRSGETQHDLSGGQWQRLAIARGLALNRPVLILDEPSASLDPGGERKIYETLLEQPSDTLRIFISHRMGCIQSAAQILVLSGGSVAEQGTHAQLMEHQGLYAAMYETQRSWYL